MNVLRTTIATAMIAMIMAGCASVQKQRSRAEQFYREHPQELAEKCANNFPPTYKPGKEIEQPRDTVYMAGDSIPCPEVTNPKTGEKTTPKVKCPDSKTIYVPKLRVDTVESTATLARIEAQRQEIATLRADLKTSNDKEKEASRTAKNRLWIIIGMGGLAVAYFGFKIYRRLKP